MPVEMEVPGSKSLSNRALTLAALINTEITIKNVAICDDTKYMIQALKKLGIKISQKGNTVKIKKGNFKKGKTMEIYTGNAGTTTRFLTALATLTENSIKIDGDKRMRERPIRELAKALNKLGAKIKTRKGCPPIQIFPQKIRGGIVNLPGNISSQYLSALLMIAPFTEKETIINIEQKLYSKPYINMTIEVMKALGFKVINKNFKQFVIKPNQITKTPTNYTIESDASSASYIGAYAALHPGKKIILRKIHKNSIQGDIKFLETLKRMGCKISETKNGTTIQGPKTLKPQGEIDMNETPDLVMTFTVLAMFTSGKTRITNIGNLRIKETDRITALKNELKKLGTKVKTGKDYIEIEGLPEKKRIEIAKKSKKISIETRNDHRIAMAFGILRDIFPLIKIKNPNCVSKSYTTFWEDLEKLRKA